MKFPIRKQDTWFHVGDLTKKTKKNSYEGAGLSVSDCPKSWRRIARLGGETYRMYRKGGRFLEMVYVSIPVRREMFKWAVEEGYLTKKNVWVYHFYDEEFHNFYEREFDTLEEAKEEADWENFDEEEQAIMMKRIKDRNNHKEEYASTLFEVTRFSATQRLLESEEWSGSCLSSQAEDFAILRYADEVLKLDGVHWDEEHDVVRLSAPRAVIFQSQLHHWKHEEAVSP